MALSELRDAARTSDFSLHASVAFLSVQVRESRVFCHLPWASRADPASSAGLCLAPHRPGHSPAHRQQTACPLLHQERDAVRCRAHSFSTPSPPSSPPPSWDYPQKCPSSCLPLRALSPPPASGMRLLEVLPLPFIFDLSSSTGSFPAAYIYVEASH